MSSTDEQIREHRLESGVVQFGDDWPGVFFRGDDAFHYAQQVRHGLEILIAERPTEAILCAMLRNLMAELLAADVTKGLPRTRLRSAKDCLP